MNIVPNVFRNPWRVWLRSMALILIGLAIGGRVFAQLDFSATGTFVPAITGLEEPVLTWGDINADGRQDLLIVGRLNTTTYLVRVYRQTTTTGTFQLQADLSGGNGGYWRADAEFIDYDMDGDLDVFISGSQNGTLSTRLFKNDGAGNFAFDPSGSVNLEAMEFSAVDAGDLDFDGDLDLVLIGHDGSLPRMFIYRYDRPSQAFQQQLEFPVGISNGDVAIGDYDRDGLPDIMVTGSDNAPTPSPATILYKNLGNAAYSAVTTNFTANSKLRNSSADWGDFDNDGDLDVLLTGEGAGGVLETKVYRQDSIAGTITFTDLQVNFPGLHNGRSRFGDFNNDGFADVVISGEASNGTATTEIWSYQPGSNTFTKETTASNSLPGVKGGKGLAMADYDNDGRLDIILAGKNTLNSNSFGLFRNTSSFNLSLPAAPGNLSASQTGATVTLTWDSPAGYNPALVEGLSYNVYIGSSPGTVNWKSPHADLTNGFRRVMRIGNVGQGSQWTIQNLPTGTYYWSVQAVGANFLAGPFATENSFVVSNVVPINSIFADSTANDVLGALPSGVSQAAAAWADIDSDGDLDFIYSGITANSGTRDSWIYKYNAGTGRFELQSNSVSLPDVGEGDLAFADYDLDGDLDLVITGQLSTTGTPSQGRVTQIFRNDFGNYSPTSLANSLPQVRASSVAWADYDNDGDPDLALAGNSVTGFITRIYRNDNGTFNQDLTASSSLVPVEQGSLDWGDFDNDGWMDLLVTGESASGTITEVFRNELATTGGFSKYVNIVPFSGVKQGNGAWGDLNNDGFLDIVVTGVSGSGQPIIQVYRNFNPFGFIPVTITDLEGVENGDLALADYNDDGYLDLVVTGENASNQPSTNLYQNTSNLSTINFARDVISSNNLQNAGDGSRVVWGDYNGDNKIDVLLAGGGSNRYFILYRNLDSNPNSTPLAPQNPESKLSGFQMALGWDAPSAASSPSVSYTYNIEIEQIGAGTIKSAESDLNNGFRKVPASGNTGHAQNYLLYDLSPGTYAWRVQTVDHDYEGSAFSASDTFTYVQPTFIDSTEDLFPVLKPVAVDSAAMAWADIDGDGLLEYLISGSGTFQPYYTSIIENDNGQFVPDANSQSTFVQVRNGSIDWGDFDLDGDVDALMTGRSGVGAVTRIYENLGSGGGGTNFVGNPYGLPQVVDGDAIWLDFDKDGRLDIALCGQASSGLITEIYLGNGAAFLAAGLNLVGVRYGDLSSADVNHDGYPDLLVMGEKSDGNTFTGLYLNDRQGGVVLAGATGLVNLRRGSSQWGDYNNDGWPDLLITGENNTGAPRTRLFRNQTDNTFTNLGNLFEDVESGQAAFNDYNNDGWSDILVIGQNSSGVSGQTVRLYQNNQGLGFTEDIPAAAPFPALNGRPAMAWGDYNNDGKLDLALTGNSSSGKAFGIYANIDQNAPTTPSLPLNLSSRIDGYELILEWDPPTNLGALITKGLSYNVFVRETGSGNLLNSPSANESTGFRRIVSAGTLQDTTAFRIRNLPSGTYNWGVQAIDADFEGGPFSVVGSPVAYEPPIFLDWNQTAFEAQGQAPGLTNGQLKWFDFDNDGDLDLLVAGDTSGLAALFVYVNDGTGRLTSTVSLGASPASPGLAIADYDLDGFLDFAVCGAAGGSTPVTRLYRNDQVGGFILQSGTLPGVSNGQLGWADYDLDGDPDLMVSGQGAGGVLLTRILVNDGSGSFTALDPGIPGFINGALEFCDLNKDKYADVILSGEIGGQPTTRIYLSDGAGNYIQQTTSLPNLSNGSLDLADFDRDGDPDLLISGLNTSNSPVTQIYANNGQGSFTFKQSLSGISAGSARWGDYNDDNLADVVLTGSGSGGQLSRVYVNTGTPNNPMQERPIGQLPVIPLDDRGVVAWGDLDNDGKLDLAIAGTRANGQGLLRVLKNVDVAPNAVPGAPSFTQSNLSADTVNLAWSIPSNGQGFTYNISVTEAQTGDLVLPSYSEDGTGYRQVVSRGNAGHGNSLRLIDLPDGKYYWKVQSIAPDFEGSAFSARDSFIYRAPNFVNANSLYFPNGAIQGLDSASLDWGDYDNDGDLDLLVTGFEASNVSRTRILRNDGDAFEVDNNASGDLFDVHNGTARWGDFNRDGRLDVLVVGRAGSLGPRVGIVYENTGGRFTNNGAGSAIIAVDHAAADWGDYDNDGDLDLVISGWTGSQALTNIYRNRNNNFVLDTTLSQSLPGLYSGSAEWGDYDRDGDLDLLLTGQNAQGTPTTKVFRNRGVLGGMIDLGSDGPSIQVKFSDADWGDYNNDGYLDILIGGETTASQVAPATAIFRFEPAQGRFVNASINLLGIRDGAVDWGDYNDDGWIDLAVTGKTGSGLLDRETRIYRNTQSGFVADTVTNNFLKGAEAFADIAFADFSGDQKLDFALLGRTSNAAPRRNLTLYINENPTANNPAGVPQALAATVDADSVILSWTEPPGYNPSVERGLTYNIRIGSNSGGEEIVASHSVPSGLRKVSHSGNTGHRRSYVIRGLESGNYFWSVQTVEPDREGSAFASEDTFRYDPPLFIRSTNIAFQTNKPRGTSSAGADWADYDGDGDLDLVISGERSNTPFATELYRNDNGQLVLDPTGDAIVELRFASLKWGDYNLDNLPDLLATGETDTGLVSILYETQSNGFVPVQNFTGLSNASIIWADFNLDGWPDFIQAGEDESGDGATFLYFNDRSGGFTLSSNAITGVKNGDLVVADVNLDQAPDLVITGEGSNGDLSEIWLNDSIGNFNLLTNSGLEASGQSSLASADFNNDGRPDLLLMGETSNAEEILLYRNDPAQGFVQESVTLPGLKNGDLVFADFNNDGYPDILATGENDSGDSEAWFIPYSVIDAEYQIDSSASALFKGLVDARLAPADYDGDGRLDVLSVGEFNSSRLVDLYLNRDLNPNLISGAPTLTGVTPDETAVVFEWSAPTNVSTPLQNGLTYNLIVRDIADGSLVNAPESDTINGYRRVVRMGNCGQSLRFRMENMPEGTFEWSVQAVTQDFEGFSFAAPQRFEFVPSAFSNITDDVFQNGPPIAISDGDIAWGDYDNDGDLDILTMGVVTDQEYATLVYTNNNGRFDLNTNISNGLVDLARGTCQWIDYDADGDLDIFLTGEEVGDVPVSRLYQNNGGVFNLDNDASTDIRDLGASNADWADYDNDGDLDLVISGREGTNTTLQLYRQTEDHRFVLDQAGTQVLPAVYDGGMDWGDFNRDGWMDLLISGRTDAGAVTAIYRNLGDGTFALFPASLDQVRNSSAEWGDYDNDGFLDILLTGETVSSNLEPVTRIYHNNLANPALPSFQKLIVGVQDLTGGNGSWGDYDNDGFLDILVSGRFGTADTALATLIYRNDRNGSFLEDLKTSKALADVDLGHSAWGDYNGDNKLDVLILGITPGSPPQRAFALYKNIDTTQNSTPGEPTALRDSIVGQEIFLIWDPPIGASSVIGPGYSYNLYISTAPNQTDIKPVNSDLVTGYRRVVDKGNVGPVTIWEVQDLPEGTYYWSVQAVDQDFEGSAFAARDTFTFIDPKPEIVDFSWPEIHTFGEEQVSQTFIQLKDSQVVDRVELHYRRIAEPGWSVAQVPIENLFATFDLIDDLFDLNDLGLEYYFMVTGRFGINAVTDTVHTWMEHPDPGFTFSGLKSGSAVSDYNLIAFPLVLTDSSGAATVEDNLGPYDIFKWRFWDYQGGLREYQKGLNSVSPGRGYWLISKDPFELNTGEGQTVRAHDQAPFTMRLRQGWNLLGNPYPYNLLWSEIMAANGFPADSLRLRIYNGRFEDGAIWQQMLGGFVFSDVEQQIIIPVRKNPNIQRIKNPVSLVQMANRLDANRWRVPIHLEAGGASFVLGGVGMDDRARDSRDRFDDIALPRLSQYLDMRFPHPEFFAGHFSFDVAHLADNYVWSFDAGIGIESELVTLRWENAYFGDNPKQLVLFDVRNQQKVDMRSRRSYTFRKEGDQHPFQVYFGDEDFISEALFPGRALLGEAYPNPFDDRLTIPFTIAGKGQHAQIGLDILSLEGRVVRKVVNEEMPSGFHEIVWDGHNDAGQKMPAGLYFYRLEVTSPSGRTVSVGKATKIE